MTEVAMTEVPAFLLEMSKQLNGQNNRCTANPVFVVQVKKWDREDINDPECYQVFDENWEGLTWFTPEEFDEDRVAKGWTAVPVKSRWEHHQSFLTEKGANAYIRCNRHNIGETRIYVNSMFRCWEMIELREWVMSLTEKKENIDGII